MRSVLITGGGGFIGSHLADELLAHGHRVRVLDSLVGQVHERRAAGVPERRGRARPRGRPRPRRGRPGARGRRRRRPPRRPGRRRPVDVRARGLHVGANDARDRGAARGAPRPAGRAAARRVEHERSTARARYVEPPGARTTRSSGRASELERGEWEPRAGGLRPVRRRRRRSARRSSSVYALTKYDQERLCLIFGAAYGIPAVALRFFNVYGPRQALSNPYTGVLAIFAGAAAERPAPALFEDGLQRRDFVSVHDVARACRAGALERTTPPDGAVNVGSGRSVTVRELAGRLAGVLDVEVEPELTDDVPRGRHPPLLRRHLARARAARLRAARCRSTTGSPTWPAGSRGRCAIDRTEQAARELAARGLTL